MTTTQAAEILNVNQSRIRAMCASGILSAIREGRDWIIDPESVESARTRETLKYRQVAHLAQAAPQGKEDGQ
jgi:excisionase family DNA binding protein